MNPVHILTPPYFFMELCFLSIKICLHNIAIYILPIAHQKLIHLHLYATYLKKQEVSMDNCRQPQVKMSMSLQTDTIMQLNTVLMKQAKHVFVSHMFSTKQTVFYCVIYFDTFQLY
jgi:transcriptional regulator of nitric oxide reductase